MAASWATSSRRRPLTWRRPRSGSPNSSGDSAARRAFRKAPSSSVMPPLSAAEGGGGREGSFPGRKPTLLGWPPRGDRGAMSKHIVSFDSNGITVAGHLYLPEQATAASGREGRAAPGPAVVVGHPGTGVKEQASGLYAGKLAAAGFV